MSWGLSVKEKRQEKTGIWKIKKVLGVRKQAKTQKEKKRKEKKKKKKSRPGQGDNNNNKSEKLGQTLMAKSKTG